MQIKSFISDFNPEVNQEHVLWPCCHIDCSMDITSETDLNFIERAVLELIRLGFSNQQDIADILCLEPELIKLVVRILRDRQLIHENSLTVTGVKLLDKNDATVPFPFTLLQDLTGGQLFPFVLPDNLSDVTEDESAQGFFINLGSKDFEIKAPFRIPLPQTVSYAEPDEETVQRVVRSFAQTSALIGSEAGAEQDIKQLIDQVREKCQQADFRSIKVIASSGSNSEFYLHTICHLDSDTLQVMVDCPFSYENISAFLTRRLSELPYYDFIRYRLLSRAKRRLSLNVGSQKQRQYLSSCAEVEELLYGIDDSYQKLLTAEDRQLDVDRQTDKGHLVQDCTVKIAQVVTDILIRQLYRVDRKKLIDSYSPEYLRTVLQSLKILLCPDDILGRCCKVMAKGEFKFSSQTARASAEFDENLLDMMEEEEFKAFATELESNSLSTLLRVTRSVLMRTEKSDGSIAALLILHLIYTVKDRNNAPLFKLIQLRKTAVADLLVLKFFRDCIAHGSQHAIQITLNELHVFMDLLKQLLSIWQPELVALVEHSADQEQNIKKVLEHRIGRIDVAIVLQHYFPLRFMQVLPPDLSGELVRAEEQFQQEGVIALTELEPPVFCKEVESLFPSSHASKQVLTSDSSADKTAPDAYGAAADAGGAEEAVSAAVALQAYKELESDQKLRRDEDVVSERVLFKLYGFYQQLFRLMIKNCYLSQKEILNKIDNNVYLSELAARLAQTGFNLRSAENTKSKHQKTEKSAGTAVNGSDQKLTGTVQLPRALAATSSNYLKKAVKDQVASLGGCFLVLMGCLPDDKLTKLSQVWPDMVLDVDNLVRMRGHGDGWVKVKELLQLKRRMYQGIYVFSQVMDIR